jgi:acetoin utilization deacetylase AcuC-like enzyme
MRTAITIDHRFRDHDTGPGHPERRERIEVIEEMLVDWRGAPLERVASRTVGEDELETVHTAGMIAHVKQTSGKEHARLDPDTSTSPESFEVALLAAGAVLELVDAVATRTYANGFAFVRPPGHHATRDRAMGFCLFNNVAIAAAHLKRKHKLARVAIVDWDLHHGNGTQAIFYDDPSVLYVSLHQYPYYPGTGAATEVGTGAGTGFTVNVPFSEGVGDDGFRAAFSEVIEPVLRQFAPEVVLVSAGFDCHRRDPLGGLEVSENGFIGMARRLISVARDVADGRIVAVLEGGYDLQAIRNSAEAVLTELTKAGDARHDLPSPEGSAEVFEPLKRILRPYWKL